MKLKIRFHVFISRQGWFTAFRPTSLLASAPNLCFFFMNEVHQAARRAPRHFVIRRAEDRTVPAFSVWNKDQDTERPET